MPFTVTRWSAELDEYVGGEITEITHKPGWVGRLSMPGYLDCTDWLAADTEEEIKALLAATYDLCPSCMQEECECDGS